MKLIGVTYKNFEIDDQWTFNLLPEELKTFLKQVNGIIAYKGGLHVRGCCIEPVWHSIKEVMEGKNAFWKHYPEILDTDIPFAEDCMGDQFLLRGTKVIKLLAETGDIEYLNLNFVDFLNEVEKDPVSFLSLQPLMQYAMEDKELEPGNLLNAYPPFCMNQGVIEIKAIPANEQLTFLANLSKQIRRSRDSEEDEGFNFIVG